MAAAAVLPRARTADRRRGARPDRARPERRLQPALGSVPLRVRGGRLGAAPTLCSSSTARNARRCRHGCSRSSPACATASASIAIRSTSRPTRARSGCARSCGRARRAGWSGSSARSRRCAGAAGARARRHRRRAAGRCSPAARGDALTVVFQTAVLGYLDDERWARVGEAIGRRRAATAARAPLDRPAGRRRPRLLGPLGAALAGRRAAAPRARRLPRRLARVAVITSPTNPTLKLVRKLLSQSASGTSSALFAVEGEDLVAAARAAGVEPIELLVAGETVEAELLAALSTLPHPARAIAVYRTADLPRERRETTLALWRVGRSGQRRHAAARGGRVRRRGCALRRLRRPARPEGATRVGRRDLPRPARRVRRRARAPRRARRPRRHAAARARRSKARSTFVLGAEREGLPEDVVAASDVLATIELPGDAESLNVADRRRDRALRARQARLAPQEPALGGLADGRRYLVAAPERPVTRRDSPHRAAAGRSALLVRPIGSTGSRVPCETKNRGLPVWPRPTIPPGENAITERKRSPLARPEREGVRAAV